jgi:uncharacterized repeat protein (TIGR01451 family)
MMARRSDCPSLLTRETTSSMIHLTNRVLLVLPALIALVLTGSIASAQAAGPQLGLTLSHTPDTFQRQDAGARYLVTLTNVGDADATGPVTLTDALPAGVKYRPAFGGTSGCSTSVDQIDAGEPLICTIGSLAVGESVTETLGVVVSADAPDTLTNTATVSGGGAASVSATDAAPVVDRPAFEVTDPTARALDENGDDYTVAGGHPYEATASFSFPTYLGVLEGISHPYPVEDVRDIFTELPPGFLGNAAAAPRCPLTGLQRGVPSCPPGSPVGELILIQGDQSNGSLIYNMIPEKGYPAEFAFKLFDNSVVMYPQVLPRTGHYGLVVTVPGAARLGVTGIQLKFYGVPSQRNGFGGSSVPFLSNQSDCLIAQPTTKVIADSWQHPARKLADGLPDLSDDLWKSATTPAPPRTGCDTPGLASQFAPTIKAGPTPETGSTAADTPSGYSVDLAFPQANDPTDPSTVFDPSVPQAPSLKDATVTLPAGVAISPSAADGLGGCSDVPGADEVRLDLITPVTCPDASKIGSVVAESPLLASHDPETDAVTGAEPIKGDVYLIKPHPGDFAADGHGDGVSRLLIELENEQLGLNVKIPGIATADKDTGRLTARFTDNPQVPAKSLRLTFKAGPRAPLANPQTCTMAATTTGTFVPWSRGGMRSDGVAVLGTPNATASSTFAIDKGANGGTCASAVKDLPFSPAFAAGVTGTQAGGSSPFVLRFTRQDGEQDLGSIDTTLPAGLLANIAAVPRCLEAQAAAGTCDGASQIGTTTVGAGAGSSPLFIPQPGKDPTAVYLAGPYKGAPFSLSIVVPAQAGPFDLGTVVVRAALYVDPIDGHATVKSDPLPTIRDGVPLRVRDVRVNVDRPGFMVLPTNCSPMAITGDIHSAAGATSQSSQPFQVKNCGVLDLNPKLDLTLSGKGQTTDNKHPAVTANLTQRSGQSNLKKVRVALPLSLALDPDNANGLCEFVDGSKVEPTCPRSSVVGTATARTPILDQPLTGPVYFVKNIRKDPKSGREIRTLPKLVIPLTGENGVKLTLTGTSAVEDNHLVTTFDNIPDAPVSSFKLDINGGKHGILVVSGADICAATQIADQGVEGQNVKQQHADVAIKTPSCPTKILSKKIGKTSVVVKVGGLGAGKVTVSGKGIKKSTKTIVTATVATITAKRTKGRPGKVMVSFDPTGPAKARKTSKWAKRGE